MNKDTKENNKNKQSEEIDSNDVVREEENIDNQHNQKNSKRKDKKESKELVEIREKNKRLLADMDNLIRRLEKEKEEILKYKASGFIIEILPTIDMFKKALETKNVSDEVKNWLSGFEMIYNNLKNVLTSEGVTEIKAEEGMDFDHNIHYAIDKKKTSEVEEGKIIEIKSEGYMLKGRMLRPATVVIATNKEESKEKEN